MSESPPIVLVISGNDPSGGAGVCADIEMLARLGVHSAPVISAITVQDTKSVYRVSPVDSSLIIAQVRCVLDDLAVRAIKIGLLCDTETIEALAHVFKTHPEIPIVLDPVLRAGSGDTLTAQSTTASLRNVLIPLSHTLTPNQYELRQLVSAADTLEQAAEGLIQSGCRNVLVTSADESRNHPDVVNQWFQRGQPPQAFDWPRLPHQYHGSGCTLAAALAGLLALGLDDALAIEQAQAITWRTLDSASKLGRGQWHPNRVSRDKAPS